MEEVVAHPAVAQRRLGADRLECRMRADGGHGSEPAITRYAEHAYPAAVIRHLLHEPVDRVVGVGALVGARMPRVERSVHVERSLGAVAAADVLKHEDIAVEP